MGDVYPPGRTSRRKLARRAAIMIESLENRVLFARVLGIDISSFQPTTINWAQVKQGNAATGAPGYSFVYCKATEGVNFTDTHFTGYMTSAHAATMPIGAYDFARYDSHQGTAGADTEAAYYWSVIKPYIASGYMMPMLDLENVVIQGVSHSPTEYGYTKTTFSNWAKEWVADITADALAIGVKITPVIYTGQSFGGTWLDATVEVKSPLWVAQYPSGSPDPQILNPGSTNTWATWSMWQFTDGSPTVNTQGKVYGLGGTNVTGSCDADVMQGDIGVLQNFIINTPGRFAANTRVTTTSSLPLYTNPDGTGTSTTVASGQVGTVTLDSIFNETHGYGSGFWNWHVAFDSGQTGWIREYETPQSPSPHTLLDWLSAGVVTSVSSTKANGSYNAGTVIPITVAFNVPVTVTGSPIISLSDGGTATYSTGTGTNTLTFNYTVAAGQTSSDLDLTNAWNAIDLNLGTIKDALGNYPDLMTAVPGATGSLGANKNIVIDTTAPTITNVTSTIANGTYTTGAAITITVAFSEAVTVTGTPTLALKSGGTATYSGGTGTTTLSFLYNVGAGQNSTDLDYTTTAALALAGGTIKDAATNNATLTLPAPGATGSLGANKAIVIDTAAPTIASVTSTVANGPYKAGALIPITVTFNESANVTGTPTLFLNSGAVVNYSSGTGTTTLTFNYTVAAGQNSFDLDYLSAAALSGTIKDAVGNTSSLSLPAPGSAGSLASNKNIAIDTAPPTAAFPNQSPAGGSGVFDFTVTYADAISGVDANSVGPGNVTVTGPGFSQAASYISYDSATGIALYEITAPGGIWNAAANGLYTVSQNAGQVKDLAGNARAAGQIGTFAANIFAYSSGGALVIDYGASGGSIALTETSGNLIVQDGAASAQFLSTSFTTINVNGGAGNDTFTLNGPVTPQINLALGAGNDTLNVASGSATFNTDASAGTSALTINASPATSLFFNASQHLAALNLTGATATLAASGDKVLVVSAISITGNGQLDLNDNSAIVDYTGASPLPGVQSLLAGGFNSGNWNGPGIASTTAHNDPANLHALGLAEASDLGVSSFAGQTVDTTALLIRYTKYGDNNLDGTVDIGNDFSLFLDGYSSQSHGWINGDYTYDGTIDLGNDFNLFLSALNG